MGEHSFQPTRAETVAGMATVVETLKDDHFPDILYGRPISCLDSQPHRGHGPRIAALHSNSRLQE
jgi:hypothetical protein